ncbi:MAG: translocation protein TolB [Schlesneria sp.]|nr:translocation protein TolB [Schlesneria sp.]
MFRWILLSGILVCAGQAVCGQDQGTAETIAIEQSHVRFAELDKNSDGFLTIDEVFLEQAPPDTDPVTTATFGIRHDWSRSLFSRVDFDGDNRLKWREWIRYEGLLQQRPLASELERQRVQQMFAGWDKNGNEYLTLDEWLAGVPQEQEQQHRRDFLIADGDRNGELILNEFAALLQVTSAPEFALADPYKSILQRRLQSVLKILNGLDSDGDGTISVMEWDPDSLSKVLPSLLPRDFATWDLDSDMAVTNAEVTLILEFAYGFRHPLAPGVLTRTSRNAVLDTGWVIHMDPDHDGKISRDEFLRLYTVPLSERWRQFELADADGDGSISLGEVASGPWFYHHGRDDFIRTDKNLDGVIDQSELAPPPREWEKHVAMRIIPAFDDDHDGTLCMSEFLLTPIANPMVSFWYTDRVDVDGDGYLNVIEFQKPAVNVGPIWLVGLVDEVFRRLDRDSDGRLGRDEFRFTSDMRNVANDQRDLFQLDHNGDGKITFEEVFNELPPATDDPTARDLYQSRLKWAKSLFDRADRSQDDWLDARESSRLVALRDWQPHSPEEEIARVEREFAHVDLNHDSTISLDEWLSGVTEPDVPRRRRDYLALDTDQNGTMSLTEFAGRIEVSRSSHFIQPDLWATWMAERLIAILPAFQSADSDKNQKLTEEEWTSVTGEAWCNVLPALTSRSFGDWDLNHDQTVDWTEVERLLQAAYGLKHPLAPAVALRRGPNIVTDFCWVLAMDSNRDGRISRPEFVKNFAGEDIYRSRQFELGDEDGNGELSFAEAVAVPWFTHNMRGEFFLTDRNLDGAISADELDPPLRAWERDIAIRLLPGFDIDGDGKLSLIEFLATPVPNVMTDWSAQRDDSNGDGQLSLEEFAKTTLQKHPWWHPFWLASINEEFFRKFDRNGDGFLSLDEYAFRINYSTIPPALAVKLLDKDGNGTLTLSEVFTDPRPTDLKSPAALDHEYRLLRAGESFAAADADENEELTAREYARYRVYASSEEGASRAILSPVPLPPPTRPLGLVDHIWRGIVIADAILLLGLAVYFGSRRGAKKLKAATTTVPS